MASIRFDISEINGLFARLESKEFRESLGRRMAVAGGAIVRDEAKQRALQSHARTAWVPNPRSRGSESPGELADAIYLAFNRKETTDTRFVYSVSWNNQRAWWGKLREFGYFQRHAVYKDQFGVYHTDKKRPLAQPKRRPARPFLAPAFDSTVNQVRDAMLVTAREEFPKLMAERSAQETADV